MTSTNAELVPIECLPGVEPSTDSTAFATKHYTFSDKIRFVGGRPEKIGGWDAILFSTTILGYCRSLFSLNMDGRIYSLIGTHSKLYSAVAAALTNITPLQITTTAAASSLATHYASLGASALSVTNGSNIVTVSDTEASKFQPGDTVTLSGSSGIANIPAASINAPQFIRSVSGSTYTFRTATTANATATGGGTITRSSGLLTVTSSAHGQANEDRVKITLATNTGGITATFINKEHIIRNATAGTFDIMTDGTAASSVTGGGGASTLYQKEIPDGQVDETIGQGYGMGLYGAGLYGVSKISTNARVYPRIWFFDRFGDSVIMTPGNQTGVYSWGGNNSVAPTLIANAPTAVNYAFVSDSILVTLGAGGVLNRVFSSDQGNPTIWTSSSTNKVYDDDIEGAGRLMSHISVNGVNLLFTENQTYTFRYIGDPLVWEIQLKEQNIGIIAPMARVAVNGTGYWMDDKNFYQWTGGDIEVMPSNSGTRSTIHEYVFKNLNYAQKTKCFAGFNKDYNEIWFHYPSLDSLECDRVARYNIIDRTWVPDTMPRTAWEYPNISLINPRLMNIGTMYKHEAGSDADGQPMPWILSSNKRFIDRNSQNQDGFIPDSIQTGTITFNVKGYQFPQSTVTTNDVDYLVSQDTERVATALCARYWVDTWSGNELGQSWRSGGWQEYIQRGAGN